MSVRYICLLANNVENAIMSILMCLTPFLFAPFQPVWMLPAPRISHLQPLSDEKTLRVRWMLNCSDVVVDFYEIQVSRTEFHTIIYSNYTLTWTSAVPLNCTDHSVRIRGFYRQSGPSPWSDWVTNKGTEPEDKMKVFPSQRFLKEGTNVTLCCVPQRGANITNMAIYLKNYSVISLGTRVKAITIPNVTFPTTPIKAWSLTCNDNDKEKYWFPVSFPPQKPRNLSCETSDMKTVRCSWDPGRPRHPFDLNKQTRTLHIENSAVAAVRCAVSSCRFPVVPQLEEYNIRVVVKDNLGEETERYRFNLSDRVFPVVDWDKVSPRVTDATLSWVIEGKLTDSMPVVCQVTTSPDRSTEVSCQNGSSLCQVRLDHLLPSTRYSAKVRCSVNGRLWGNWTSVQDFTTNPLVTLNIWRIIQKLDHPHSRQLTLLWIPHVTGSGAIHIIKGYVVQWSQKDQNMTEQVDGGRTQTQMSIGSERCDLTVTAVVSSGASVPAHITIPQMNDTGILPVEKRLKDGFTSLSWDKWDKATCGYTVEWCIQGHVMPCALQWMIVADGNNTLLLPNLGHFKAGYRYTFNIYGCTEDGHHHIEIQTGYSQQLQSIASPSLVEPVQTTSSSVTLQWLYAEDDPAHPAFITGYSVTVQESGYDRSQVTVADAHMKSVTIEDLQQNQEYIFSVCALSEAGPGQTSTISIRTRANYSSHMAKILIPSLLLLACVILLWPQRKRLKTRLMEVFAYPAGMNIKTRELERFLYEVWTNHLQISSNAQRQLDCASCNAVQTVHV
uniref:Oncostatin-M-specific receptor subunit beta-like n=1 Tax=Sphaeramia orbicularis TaxID=375764 RepID=A0A672ZJU3_9TELE